MKTKIALIASVIVSIAFLMQCGDDTNNNTGTPNPPLAVNFVVPVNLPTNIVPGFHFPEDSNTIYQWVSGPQFDSVAIYSHAWGIWAGLTAQSGQVYQGVPMRVFETWLGITEIQTIIQSGAADTGKVDLTKAKNSRTLLARPNQLNHNQAAKATIDSSFDNGNNLFVSVAYNNAAAAFAIEKSILKQSVLNTYYSANAIGRVPAFPNDAITLKPTYFAAKPQGNLIRIPVWPGEPQTLQAYPFGAWDNYVYADTTNSQQPGKALTPVNGAETDPTQIAGATCNLTDFIYYKMDSTMAAYVNQEQSSQGAAFVAGDMAILVAMHVATKEISNWTWQTFYWDPNPSSPKFPGHNLSKPTQLSPEAAHYSASTAYAMLAPNQPISGGNNNSATYKPVFGYNPYLEAVFGPSTFDSITNAYNANYLYGVQTNCMTCHSLANYSPNVRIGAQDSFPIYSADQYVDMNDAIFKSRVQLDFAWSIIGNMIPATSANK